MVWPVTTPVEEVSHVLWPMGMTNQRRKTRWSLGTAGGIKMRRESHVV